MDLTNYHLFRQPVAWTGDRLSEQRMNQLTDAFMRHQASNYLNQWWSRSVTHKWVTRHQYVNWSFHNSGLVYHSANTILIIYIGNISYLYLIFVMTTMHTQAMYITSQTYTCDALLTQFRSYVVYIMFKSQMSGFTSPKMARRGRWCSKQS